MTPLELLAVGVIVVVVWAARTDGYKRGEMDAERRYHLPECRCSQFEWAEAWNCVPNCPVGIKEAAK